MASPWDYFDQKLKRAGIPSPIPEIQKKEEVFDTVTLDYNHWEDGEKSKEEVPVKFYNFLVEAVQFVGGLTANPAEIDGFFSHLNILVETQIYSKRCYKLDSPQHVERILEVLDEKQIKVTKEMADFFSYFKLPDSLKKELLRIIPGNTRHPLVTYLVNSLQKDDPSLVNENIGIEIEGIPRISMGSQAHPGFEMGIDGGGTMPELRRKKDEIAYNKSFKEDLFHLWYWAKMSRLAGASIHIHIDNPGDPKTVETFRRMFGFTNNDIRVNNYGKKHETIEVRLNLPYYNYLNSDSKDKSVPPFEPDIYSFNGLIEEIIRLKQNAAQVSFMPDKRAVVGNHQLGKGLSPFWQARFVDRGLTIEEAIVMLERNIIPHDIIQKLSTEALTIHTINKLTKAVRNNHFFIRGLINKIPSDVLTPALAYNLIEKSRNDREVMERVIRKMPSEALTKPIAKSLMAKSNYDPEVFGAILQSLSSKELTLELTNEYLAISWINRSAIASVIGKLSSECLTDEVIREAMRVSKNDKEVIYGIADKMPLERLSVDMAKSLIEKSNNDHVVIDMIIRRLPAEVVSSELGPYLMGRINIDGSVMMLLALKLPSEALTMEMVNKMLAKSESSLMLLTTIASRLPEERLTVETIHEFASMANYKVPMLETLIQGMSLDVLMGEINYLVEKSGHNSNVISAIVDRLPEGTLSVQLANSLVLLSANSWYVIEKVVRKLSPNDLTEELINNLVVRSDADSDVITRVVEKAPQGVLSLESLFNMISLSKNYGAVIEAVVNKIPTKDFSIGVAKKLLEFSEGNNDVVELIVDKLRLINTSEAAEVIRFIGNEKRTVKKVSIVDSIWDRIY